MNIAEIKLDILDLLSLHSHVIDGTDPEAFADLFTEDGTYAIRAGGKETVHARGRNELSAHAARLFEERGNDQPRHHIRNTIFLSVSDTRASTATYFLATNVSGKGGLAVVTATGIYSDDMVLTETGWKIEKRIANYD